MVPLNLNDRLVALKATHGLMINQRMGLVAEVESLKKRLSSLSDTEILLGESAQVLKQVAEICEVSSKTFIEKVIDHGLRVIFDETDKFNVRLETKARAVYAYMTLGEGGTASIMDSRGGGYVDIISVLTVLVLILQQKENMRRFIVLDEAFAEVGTEHLEKVGKFLRFLVEKLGMTILLVTHSEELASAATLVYDVEMRDGDTKLKRRESHESSKNSNG